MLTTARMCLVPATVELARVEIEDRAAFSHILSATVPANWPPESAADALPWFLQQLLAAPHAVGWFAWYGVRANPAAGASELVAGAGFKGPPCDGAVEVGYSVLPQHQGQGFATEMVGALVAWAFAQPGVRLVLAQTMDENVASVRLLRRLGFQAAGAGEEPGHTRYEINVAM